MLTLRQIEVIRATMVTGTVGGAARLPDIWHRAVNVGSRPIFSCLRQGGSTRPTPRPVDNDQPLFAHLEIAQMLMKINVMTGGGDRV